MQIGEPQPSQSPGYIPAAGFFTGQPSPTLFAPETNQAAGYAAPYRPTAPPGNTMAYQIQTNAAGAGTSGIVSLIGQTLRTLDEIYALAGHTLEQAQGPEARQSLWQLQQLANQARSYSYQMRGMILQ